MAHGDSVSSAAPRSIVQGPDKIVSAIPPSSVEIIEQQREERVLVQRSQLHDRINEDFSYHPPGDVQAVLYEEIRSRFRGLAHYLVETVPPGRELSTVLTKLEEAVMHANAGIARHG